MIERLRYREMAMLAEVFRVAQADNDSFENVLTIWQELAKGKKIGEDIDYRGRPITDNLEDFIGFVQFDPEVLRRYRMEA